MQLEPFTPLSHPPSTPLESTNPLQESIEPFPIGLKGDISDIIVEVPEGSEEEIYDTKIDDIDSDSEINGWFSIAWTHLTIL